MEKEREGKRSDERKRGRVKEERTGMGKVAWWYKNEVMVKEGREGGKEKYGLLIRYGYH